MPKQVDHEQYRIELATRASEVFVQHGYSGLSMRRLASELGISKSALYHYFPTKEALFAACSRLATEVEAPRQRARDLRGASLREKIEALVDTVRAMEGSFAGELSLLMDYTRDLSPGGVAIDENMQLANERYLEMVAEFVGEKHAKPVLCLLLGTMLQRLLDGQSTDFVEVQSWLSKALGAK